MHSVRHAVMLAGLLVLSACQDSDPLAPPQTVGGDVRRLSGCLWFQLGAPAPGDVGAATYQPDLPTVIVRADIPVWWGGMIHTTEHVANAVTAAQVFAQMDCALTGTGATLTIVESDSAARANDTPLPLPRNVDPNFWNSLKPKEQRALLEVARILRRTFPALRNRNWEGHYDAEGTEGAWITEFLQPKVIRHKERAHLVGLDFGHATFRGAVFGAAHYACSLFKDLRSDSEWPLYPDESLSFVLTMGDAFAWSYFATQPARAIRVVNSMARLTGAAYADYSDRSCLTLVHEMVQNDRTLVEDPIGGPLPPDDGSGGGGGPQDPGGILLRQVTGR